MGVLSWLHRSDTAAFPPEVQYKYVNIKNNEQGNSLELAISFKSVVFVDDNVLSDIFKECLGFMINVLLLLSIFFIFNFHSFQKFYTVVGLGLFFFNGDMERILITFSV